MADRETILGYSEFLGLLVNALFKMNERMGANERNYKLHGRECEWQNAVYRGIGL